MGNKTKQEIENKYKMSIRDVLLKFYIDADMNIPDTAKEMGVAILTIKRWLKECDICKQKLFK